MANNKMLIDAAHPEETRVAMVRGNRVDEFDFESEHKTQLRGNIYLAKVTRVEPSLQAAFVDYGGNRHGFLAFSEIHPDYYQIPLADRQALLEAEAADARADEEAQSAAEDDNETEEKPARKRRSRSRGGRKSTNNDETSESEESSEENAPEADSETVVADSEPSDEPAEKPKRTRRTRKAKSAPKEDETAAADSEENDDSDDEIGAENDGEDVVSEPADDKPKRRRTSRPKKVKAETSETGADTVAEPAVSEEEAPKKRRTSRRKKAEPTSEESTSEPVEVAEEAAPAKRRTTRRKKAEPETTETVVAEDGNEEKPKKRRSTRRKKPEDDAPAETTADADSSSEVNATEEPAEEAPKKRRTSRRRKSGNEAEETPTTEVVAEEVEAKSSEEEPSETDSEEAPTKRRRSRGRGRGRGRKNNNDAVETTDSEDDDDDSVEAVGAEDALEELPTRRTSRRHYKIQEVIKRRQILLVQVVKEERGNKGAALTTYLSLAGRYSVLMPNTARGGGISRKITNASDRKRLKAIATGLDVPAGMGVILRTAGASRTEAEVQRDFEYLLRLWENVRTLTLESTAPFLVYEEGSLIKRSIRDLYDKDTGEIIVAGEDGFREAKEFMAMLMPDHANNVKLYKDNVPMFAKLGVESQLDAMLQPQVTLKSGGYLVINQTEALVAIDVNSGRSTRQHSIEETAVSTNLEAADEVARQLRLRDLAGLIVIDFIDMEERRNNRAVEKRLKDALKHDRARIQVGRISHFGLMEMSRQRIRASVLESTTQICPTCEGVGHVRSSSSVVLGILRTIEEQLNKNSRNNLTVKVHTPSAVYLLNNKREHLSDLESRFGVSLLIEIDDTIGLEPCVVERGEPARRRPSVETAVQPDTIAPDVTQIDEPVQEAPAPAPTDGSEEGQPDGRKRRRRRRRRKGQDQQEQSSDGSGENNTEVQAEPAEVVVEEQPVAEEAQQEARKPRRRTSRAKKTDDVEETPTSDASEEKSDDNPVAEETQAEKPKRTRRSRSKKVDTEETPDAVVVSSTDAAEETDDEKPKRRRTTRRKKEDEAEPEIETVAVAEPEAPPEVEKSGGPKKDGWWKRKFF